MWEGIHSKGLEITVQPIRLYFVVASILFPPRARWIPPWKYLEMILSWRSRRDFIGALTPSTRTCPLVSPSPTVGNVFVDGGWSRGNPLPPPRYSRRPRNRAIKHRRPRETCVGLVGKVSRKCIRSTTQTSPRRFIIAARSYSEHNRRRAWFINTLQDAKRCWEMPRWHLWIMKSSPKDFGSRVIRGCRMLLESRAGDVVERLYFNSRMCSEKCVVERADKQDSWIRVRLIVRVNRTDMTKIKHPLNIKWQGTWSDLLFLIFMEAYGDGVKHDKSTFVNFLILMPSAG